MTTDPGDFTLWGADSAATASRLPMDAAGNAESLAFERATCRTWRLSRILTWLFGKVSSSFLKKDWRKSDDFGRVVLGSGFLDLVKKVLLDGFFDPVRNPQGPELFRALEYGRLQLPV